MKPEVGEPRFVYMPLPASPMAIALLMITLIVALTGIPVWLLSENPYGPWWLWVLAPLVVLGLIILAKPAALRIYDHGLDLPLPLWRRLLRFPRYRSYDDVLNLYPRLYYVAGALMSPFAASVGTVEHLGLSLELRDGREVVLKFTPGVPRFSQGQEEGYKMVVDELREVFLGLGRPWVLNVQSYSDDEIRLMKSAAAKPLMPFSVIALSFFAPVGLIPLLFSFFSSLEAVSTHLGVVASVLLGILPMVMMLAASWRRSRRRHHYLKEISKFNQWEKEQMPAREAT